MGLVEQKYHEPIDALTPQERVARAAETGGLQSQRFYKNSGR